MALPTSSTTGDAFRFAIWPGRLEKVWTYDRSLGEKAVVDRMKSDRNLCYAGLALTIISGLGFILSKWAALLTPIGIGLAIYGGYSLYNRIRIIYSTKSNPNIAAIKTRIEFLITVGDVGPELKDLWSAPPVKNVLDS